MKKLNIKTAAILVAVLIILFLGCKKNELLATTDSGYEYLPQDVKESCTVTETDFNSWFKSGKATENGLVEPANSVTFPHNNNCDFYKWSEQMFLWITSPSSGSYGNKGTILESPVFYNVSPPDPVTGKRTLDAHKPNTLLSAVSNINQSGPNRLPILIDKSGKLFEIEPEKIDEKVKNEANKLVQVDHVVANEKGLHSFFDVKGNVIKSPKAIIDSKINPLEVVQEFKVGNKSIFLDSKGNEVQSEQGQAGSHGALMGENKSLVYYITMVNDVYAYFLTGVNEGKLNGNQFPTTAGARDSIVAYAKTKGWATPPDADALAIELKTSWVEAKDLPNLENYITVKAIIPTYDKSNPNKWVENGQTTTKLALVGMHIVGSVAGHPEMIWATFEHEKNSPNSAYSYVDKNDKIKQVAADTGKGWLFNANANDTTGTQNIQNMTVSGDTILIKNPALASPTARRIMAWGVASNTVPNGEDKTPADSNSELISINNVVRKMLVGKDVRKNYLLIGATWTFGGAGPNGNVYPYGAVNDSIPAGDAIGTGQLSNSTMETYVQPPTSASTEQNSISCFSCHNNNNGVKPSDLSHVFEDLISLPANNKRNLIK
jgi:hypothetical protein